MNTPRVLPYECLIALRENMCKLLNDHFDAGKQDDCETKKEAIQLYLSSN